MRARGDKGEDWACRYLERQDLKIVARNFCVRGGEIDVVARGRDGQLIFFEIKLRMHEPVDHAMLLPRAKKRSLRRAINGFLAAHRGGRWRFDLLLLVVKKLERRVRVIWYKSVSLT